MYARRSNLSRSLHRIAFSLLFLLTCCSNATQFSSPSAKLLTKSDIQSTSKSEPESTEKEQIEKEAEEKSTEILQNQNRICVDYVKKFITGATGMVDVCTGLDNAYKAAKCSSEDDDIMLDYSELGPLEDPTSQSSKPSSPTQSPSIIITSEPTVFPSIALINDDLQNWECCSALHSYYSSNCYEDSPQLNNLFLLSVCATIIICVFITALIRKYSLTSTFIIALPEAGGCIFVGAVIGGVLKMAGAQTLNFAEKLKDYETLKFFSENFFLNILLPPIVFTAALNINKRSFRLHLLPISLFAVIGTAFSAGIVALIVYGLSNIDNNVESIPSLESLIFGALISSIDPVVILNILNSAGMSDDDSLYIILFGESLLNDGIAISLFRTLSQYLHSNKNDSELGVVDAISFGGVLHAIYDFVRILFGSIIIGLLSGVFCKLFFWYLKGVGSERPMAEVAVFFAWAMVPTYITGMLNLSGIISLVSMGFFSDINIVRPVNEDYTNHGRMWEYNNSTETETEPDSISNFCSYRFYKMGRMSTEASKHVRFVFEVISYVAETIIFVYLGMFLYSEDFTWDWRLNGIAIFACMTSRVGMVFFMGLIVDVAEHFQISKCIQHFLSTFRTDRLSRTSCDISASEQSTRDSLVSVNTEEDGDADVTVSTSGTNNISLNIDLNMKIALICAGLRGAVSLALVQSLPLYNASNHEGTHYKRYLKAMTSSTIIFTVFVLGGSTRNILIKLGLINGNSNDQQEQFNLGQSQRNINVSSSTETLRTRLLD